MIKYSFDFIISEYKKLNKRTTMRNLIEYLICGVLLLNAYVIQAQTQEQELKNTPWSLHKIIMNDVEYFAPINEERSNVIYNLSFNEGVKHLNEDILELNFCFSFSSERLTFLENQQFSVDGWISLASTESVCSMHENIDYNFLYYSVMNIYGDEDTLVPIVYSYEITPLEHSTKQLIITNRNGDQAYFHSANLSNATFKLQDLTIYPNPMSDVLCIDFSNSLEDHYIYKIYDFNGKLLKVFENKVGKQITLDIENFIKGIYWLEINKSSSLQNGHFFKVIKK